jgi:hypothetical protein
MKNKNPEGKTPKRAPRPGEGRPTLYRPEYCEMLVQHMAEGLSYSSFAAVADVCFDTLYEWEKVYPEFSEAKKRGRPKAKMTLEKTAMMAVRGELEKYNATMLIFMLKNMFPEEYKDRQEVQSVNKTTHAVDQSVIESLKEAVADIRSGKK